MMGNRKAIPKMKMTTDIPESITTPAAAMTTAVPAARHLQRRRVRRVHHGARARQRGDAVLHGADVLEQAGHFPHHPVRYAVEPERHSRCGRHRADERKHYLMFKRWFELQGRMPLATGRGYGHIDRFVRIAFGRAIDRLYPAKQGTDGEVILELDGVSHRGVVRDMSPQIVTGRTIGTRELMMRIAAPAPATIEAYVSESTIEAVQVGQEVNFVSSRAGAPSVRGAADHVVVEEPLRVHVEHRGVQHLLGSTMRTPGQDVDLAVGLAVGADADVH